MSMNGKYIRGWKYDWAAARKEYDALMAAGRDVAAAFCADPGCVSCPVCGELHWFEFEVYECSRCGAEVAIDIKSHDRKSTAGPPKYPEKVRPLLVDGLRVRYLGTLGTDIDRNPKWFAGRWPAGTIERGECATVESYEAPHWRGKSWRFRPDGRTPKEGYEWGMFGPFLDDTWEVIK